MNATMTGRVAVGLAAAVLVSASRAAAEVRANQVEPVVVTATRTPVPAGGALGSLDVVTAEQIAAAAAPDVKAALALVPTLVFNDSGGPGGVATLSLRGSTSQQVLVLVDGHRVANAQSSFFNLNDLPVPVERVARIEVLPNPASALYGADALGGVVNIVTRPPGTAPGLSFSAGLGDDAETRFAGGLQHAVGKLGLRLDGRFHSGDGFRDNGDFDLKNFAAGLAVAPAPWGIDVRWTSLEREAGVPGPLAFPSPNARQQDERDEVRADFSYLPGKRWDVKAGVFTRRQSLEFDDPDPPDFDPQSPAAPVASRHENRSRGVETQLDLDTGAGELYTLGGEWIADEIESSNDGEHETDHWGVFAQDQWRSGSWSAVGAVRRDDHEIYGGKTTISLSGGWEAAGWKFSGTWAQGYRAPNFDDLYWNEEFLQGNPDLKPETSESYEGSAQYGGAEGRVRLNVFRRDVSDLIRWVDSDGDYVYRPENVARARIDGWETEVLYRPSATIAIPIGYQRLSAEDRDTGERLAGSVRSLWRAAVQSTGSSFSWSVDYSLTDRGEYLLSDEAWSYGVVNAALSWRHAFSKGAVQVSLRAENLQDKDYQTVEGYPQRGRSWYAEVKVEL